MLSWNCSAALQPLHSDQHERHITEYGFHEKITAAMPWSGRCASCNTLLDSRSYHPRLTACGGLLFSDLNYAPKVVFGVELDGTKLPQGRYYAPINRPCRTRKKHSELLAIHWLEPNATNSRTCGNGERIKASRPNSGIATIEIVAMTVVGSNARGNTLRAYRTTAARFTTATVFAVCGTQTDSLVYTVSINSESTASCVGSGAFPAVVPDYLYSIN